MLPGRSREVARVDDLLGAARSGRGGTLVIRGEPGIGKTRLLEHTAERAADMTALEARGIESDSELPFAGLFDLLRPLSDEDISRITRTLPAEHTGDLLERLRTGRPVSVDRFAVCTVLLRLLSSAAEHRPVAICVDDVQWLDPASADAIMFAARRIRHDRVAVLLAVRDDADAVDLRGFEELPLRGLDGSAAAELLRAVSESSVTDKSADRLAAATGGNPLALLELARDLGDRDAAAWDPSMVTASRSAVGLFRDRLAALDDEARAALVVLALDTRNRPAHVWRAAEQIGAKAEAFERLELASLVTFRDGTPRLVHPLIRSAALAEVPPPLVRAAHRAWAAALASPSLGSPTELSPARAWHLAAAAVGPDPEAADALDEAGTAAGAVSAYGTEALALERASQLTEDHHLRGDRLLRAGVAARFAGRPAHAARLLDEAAGCAVDPLLSAVVDSERGRRHLYHGQVSEAHRLATQGAEKIRDVDPSRASDMLGIAAWTAMIAADYPRSIAVANDARALAGGRPGGTSPLVDLTLGTSLFSVGEVAESYQVLLAACGRVEREFDTVDPEYACFAGVALAWVGEYRRARTLLARVTERARPASAFGVLCSALHASAYVDARTGHLVSAYATANEAVATSETTGNDLWRYFSLGCLAFVEAALGREADCRGHAEEALALTRTMDIGHSAPVREALGLLELAIGNPEAAIEQLEPVNRRGSTGELTLGRPTGPDMVEAHIRAGRPLPPLLAQQVTAFSVDPRFPGLAALCWRCRGLMAPDDEIDLCFANAVALHEQTDNPFALARTLMCHGERLRRAGRRAEARDRLAAALDRFEQLGARAWAVRTEAELRTAGAGVRPERRPSGVDALTGQELQVALAVTRDLSNRQVAAELYLSPKTVEFHLGNVYRKLGIRSRTGLAAVLADRPAMPVGD
jgi:DNA-binding CsgD family transcriptional regulator